MVSFIKFIELIAEPLFFSGLGCCRTERVDHVQGMWATGFWSLEGDGHDS